MSAVLRPIEPRLAPMHLGQVDAVLAIEVNAYTFPWTRGNFIDSLVAGYPAEVLHGDRGEPLGYYVAMHGAQEMHLLNLTIAPAHQRCGFGGLMLQAVIDRARSTGSRSIWLEVRTSNLGARTLYERFGFAVVGLRRGYYPALLGQREDASVMSRALDAGTG
jgi:[ribosomal protein S18]-alanine N-acetyltransferase